MPDVSWSVVLIARCLLTAPNYLPVPLCVRVDVSLPALSAFHRYFLEFRRQYTYFNSAASHHALPVLLASTR